MDTPTHYIDQSLTESHTDNICFPCIKGHINISGIVRSSENHLNSKYPQGIQVYGQMNYFPSSLTVPEQ